MSIRVPHSCAFLRKGGSPRAHSSKLCNWRSAGIIANPDRHSSRFSFALWLFYHFPAASANPIRLSLLPTIKYSFKVVVRVFRDFHSVPVKTHLCSSWNICTYNRKTLLCSDWNILYVQGFRQERSPAYAPALWPWNFTSTSLRSSSDTWNMARGFRFMKLATNTSGIWSMRVL